jgi:hypothetical protein
MVELVERMLRLHVRNRTPTAELGRRRGTLPVFLSDVKAQQDRMVELVERTRNGRQDRR